MDRHCDGNQAAHDYDRHHDVSDDRATPGGAAALPEHHHPQEQIAHVLSGRIRMIAAGVPHELGAGDSFYIASNAPHAVETIEDTTVLDTFSPPRDDYLALDRAVATD